MSNTPRKKKIPFFRIVFILVLASIIVAGIFYADQNDIRSFDDLMAHIEKQVEEPANPRLKLCIGDSVPQAAFDAASSWTEGSDIPEDAEVSIVSFHDEPSSDCSVTVSSSDLGDSELVWRRYFALMARHTLRIEDISEDDLASLLAGESLTVNDIEISLAIDETAQKAMDYILGVGVSVETVEDIATAAETENVIGLGLFDQLTPRLTEIAIDGKRLLDGSADYPLVEEVWVDEGEYSGLFDELRAELGEVNYNPEELTTVVLTGTSVVGARGLYQRSVEVDDWLYPVRRVADILRDADIAHLSNEASFVADCVQNTWTMSFCGPTDSFELLTWAGIDVVGLTGNHILDYGAENFNTTLDMYTDAGIEYFGGGRTYDDAHTAAIIDILGVKYAFLGYNMIPPAEYYAEGASPGSARLTEEALSRDIEKVKNSADFVFVDMQWGDEYQHFPNSYQQQYGRLAIEAGADVVTGVHPHWVQPVEYYRDGVIFHGLGNFLFDQLWSLETREGIMVKHYFYGKQYLGFDLMPTLLSNNFQIEFAEGDEKGRILDFALEGVN